MKKYLAGFLLAGLLTVNAQNTSDYKYVIVPEKFSGFDGHQYQLDRLLNLLLSKKNYEILSSEKAEWPPEVLHNPCLALTSDIEKGKSFLNNKLALTLSDCNKKEIFRNEGISNIKEYDKGYQDALRQAAGLIGMQNAKEIPQAYETNEIAVMPAKVENSVQQERNETGTVGTEFRNGNQIILLTELKDGSFMLIQKDNSSVIAQLKPSSKPGVYHATIFSPNGNYGTLGFYDGKTISIEYSNGNTTEYKKAD